MHLVDSLSDGKWFLNLDCLCCPILCLLTYSVLFYSGGASQWGIKTVLGIPIPSPNVGRIVILLYSRHDRIRDPEMVRRITEELSKVCGVRACSRLFRILLL
jgi:hypothetical protein